MHLSGQFDHEIVGPNKGPSSVQAFHLEFFLHKKPVQGFEVYHRAELPRVLSLFHQEK